VDWRREEGRVREGVTMKDVAMAWSELYSMG